MAANPVYRVIAMEASDFRNIYNYEVTVQLIPEDEAIDMANGRMCEEYERPAKQRMNVTEETFHSLRIGMLYQVTFSTANLPEVA